MTCDVSEVEEFDTSVQVKYSNESGEAQFTLLKAAIIPKRSRSKQEIMSTFGLI